MSFPRYERYKDSGVEWLGDVPEHWAVIPLKRLADFINGDTFKPTEWAESGTPIIRIQNLNGGEEFNFYDGEVEPRYLVHDGDLLFGWSGNRGTSFGPFLWKRKEVCALNQHIFRVVPKSASKQVLYWTLKAVTAHVEDQAHGIIGMVHITKGDLGAINVPIPSEQEHHKVATFLGQETAKIDELIEEQRRLIELLKEKRQTVISHSVTKGLTPNALMKDSGIEWLGEVPSNWSICPVKELAKAGRKTFTDGDWVESPFITDDGVRLIQTGNVGTGFYKEQGFRYISEESFEELGCTEIFPDDVLICRLDGPVGRACMVPDLGVRMITSVDNTILKVDAEIDARFVVYLMVSAPWLNWIDVLCRVGGGFRVRVSRKMLGDLRVPCPPYSDQVNIANFLDRECTKVDGLIAQAGSVVGLLQERRSALISAAVTGKIDVRNYSPKEVA